MADATPTASADQPEQAPAESKPLSVQEAVDSIADILDDAPAEPDHAAPEGSDAEPPASNPDPLGDDEAVEPETAPEPDDGSQNAGQYVSPKAKFKLADGSEITVGELARNNLYQRDYSQKTEALARDKKAFEDTSKRVGQLERQLSEERQFVTWFAQNFVPQPPQRPNVPYADDPIGHGAYRDELDRYNAFVESFRQFKQQADGETKRKSDESQRQGNERAGREVKALMDAVKIDPKANPDKAKSFFEALANGAKEHFGLSEAEVANALKQDHRFGLVLRTAVRALQSKKTAPEVEAKLKTVPKMRTAPTARAAPGQQQARDRQNLAERQRQSGSIEDSVARLSSLI